MANPDHLKVLRKGVKSWNTWRKNNPGVLPDLSPANLKDADLHWADLSRTDLSGAHLSRANLSMADLRRADLSGAYLHGADLSGAHFSVADLSGAHLHGADLSGADLSGTDLSTAIIVETALVDVDLSQAKGLETVKHLGPSLIGIDTIYKSKGQIPEAFLRGAGVPDDLIDYFRSVFTQPIQFYSCFISYSSQDEEFAQRLHRDLQGEHVRCWFAPEDLKIGDRFRKRIDEAIRLYDKLLVVLSENSIHSAWVEKEVETAFEEERKRGTTVLFPVRLDDAVMKTNQAWAADIRRTRHIGDFRRWKDHDSFKRAFDRLLRALQAEAPATTKPA